MIRAARSPGVPRPASAPCSVLKAGAGLLGKTVRSVLTTCLLAISAMEATSEPALIAHPSVAVDALTVNEARLFLTLRLLTWPDDTPVTVFVLPDDAPTHGEFIREALRLFPYQLRRVWDKQLFAGTGQVPTTVADEQEMLRRVAETPGALGYVRAPAPDPGVRVLRLLP